jgi:hypothetical protein
VPLLQELHPDLWVLHHPLRVAGFELGHRMTVARLASGRLLVHSPVTLDAALGDEVAALGHVAHVVAPNLMHNLYLDPWLRRFDDALFHAPPGFARRYPELRQPRELGVEPPMVWREELDQELVGGMPKLNEVVLRHRASRTLIVADLLFNLPRGRTWSQRSWRRLNGVEGRPATSRMFRMLVRDRFALARSIDRILRWDFDRLVVGHGEVIETGAREALRHAFAWL